MDRSKVGPGAGGVFRSDAEADVLLVQVEVHPLRETLVTEVIEVLDVMPQRVGRADGGTNFEGHRLDALRPGGQGGAAGGREVGGGLGAITQGES